MLKKLLSSILFIFILLFVASPIFAQSQVFTLEELSQFDGKDGRKAYYAYEGKVYDVTSSKLWKLGEHFGVQAGKDLTGLMEGAPHGTEVFASFEVVGIYASDSPDPLALAADSISTDKENDDPELLDSDQDQAMWYEGRLRPLGFSVLGWTGIFLGIFFVLTFATCFGLPWAKLPLPWAGSKPGPDPLDHNPNHMGWSSVHKYFVWVTVILGVIHGLIGFLQMVGIYL
jgi:predicted heme/steroid binding protein